MRANDVIIIGQVDIVWHRFEVNYRVALNDPDHELYTFANSVSHDDLMVGVRVMFRVLVAAGQDESHGLFLLAEKYIPSAVGARLYEDYTLIQSFGLGHLLNRGMPTEAIFLASTIRDDNKERLSKINKARGQKRRPKAVNKLRLTVMIDMASKRERNPDLLFSEWLERVLHRGPMGEFEISRLEGEGDEKYEIGNSSGAHPVVVKRSTMANDWWVKAKLMKVPTR